MRFRVTLDNFTGPLDLLLYLVRKHELDALGISVTLVIDQFLELLSVWEEIDMDSAGDFLDVATRLMEIKSREMLPRHEAEEPEVENGKRDLVARLLEYKRYKEAAQRLDEQGRRWQRRRRRSPDPQDQFEPEEGDQPLYQVEIWDLVNALNNVLKRTKRERPTHIRYDDTPISVYMEHIAERLARDGRMQFTDLFAPEMHRSQLIGLFLALLELIRHRRVAAEQETLFGVLWIVPSEPVGPAASEGA